MRNLENTLSTYDLILVDTMNVAFVAHFSKPLSFEGRSTGMVYGVLQLILSLKKRYPKARIVFLWEGFNSLRKSMYPSYKSNRPTNRLNEFRESIQDVNTILRYMGVYQATHAGIEADDLAGYYCAKYGNTKKILLVSNDKDWLGFVKTDLISVQIKGLDYDKVELRHVCSDFLRKQYRRIYHLPKELCLLDPSKLPYFKVIMGDSADNISSVVPRFHADVALQIAHECENKDDLLTCNFNILPLYKETLLNSLDNIKQNIDLIIFNPDWVNPDRIQLVNPVIDRVFLKDFLEKRGMHVFLRQLNL